MTVHELSPAQYAASVGLSDEVLELAAAAVYTEAVGPIWDDDDYPDNLPYAEWRKKGTGIHLDGGITPGDVDRAVRAALPVLVPAIREALVREIEAKVYESVGFRGSAGRSNQSYVRGVNFCLGIIGGGHVFTEEEILLKRLLGEIPANEEGAS